jgi:hypothetical protein
MQLLKTNNIINRNNNNIITNLKQIKKSKLLKFKLHRIENNLRKCDCKLMLVGCLTCYLVIINIMFLLQQIFFHL